MWVSFIMLKTKNNPLVATYEAYIAKGETPANASELALLAINKHGYQLTSHYKDDLLVARVDIYDTLCNSLTPEEKYQMIKYFTSGELPEFMWYNDYIDDFGLMYSI